VSTAFCNTAFCQPDGEGVLPQHTESDGLRQARSKTVATPWPKPMHIVATPVDLSFAFMR
jgi:hypothetical protein